MTSVNILPGSLNVTGNISATQASVGGNLVVGSDIYVTGNLYSANVTVSGGGGGTTGVTSISALSGLSVNASTGNVTISAVVAGINPSTGIIATPDASGIWTIANRGVLDISAGIGIQITSSANGVYTLASIGGGGTAGVTSISAVSGLTVNSSTGNVTISAVVAGLSAGVGITTTPNTSGIWTIANNGVTSISAVSGLTVNSSTGNVTISAVVAGLSAGVGITTTPNTSGIWTIANRGVLDISAGIGIQITSSANGVYTLASIGGGGTIGVTSISALSGLSVNASTGNVTISAVVAGINPSTGIIATPDASGIWTIANNGFFGGNNLFNFTDTVNNIGGVSLAGGRIITSALDENIIGGVTLVNGRIRNDTSSINIIGGITLFNRDIFGVNTLNLKNDGVGIISNVKQIIAVGPILNLSVGGVCRINDLVIDSTGGSGPILRTAGIGSNFYISADPSSASGTTNSVYVTNIGSLVGNRYLLSNAGGGGRINIFGSSGLNDSGPKGILETISGGTEVAVGQYRNSVNASDALNIYCGPDPRIVVKNDIVNFRTPITNGALTIGNDGFNGYIQPIGGASYVYVLGNTGNFYIYKDTGRILNSTATSNDIGGVVLSNGFINSKTIATFSQDGSGRSSWLTDIAGTYDLVWFQLTGDRNWRYIRAFIPTNSFTRDDGNIIPLVNSGNAFNVQDYSTPNGPGLYRRGYQWDGTVGGNIVRLYITRINQITE